MRKTRCTLTFHRSVVHKRYKNPGQAAHEIGWYQRMPWAAPKLVDADPAKGVLVIAYHPAASQLPDYRPIQALRELLEELEADGVHHRDVHPANIVAGPDGPLLIDWETATQQDAPSFDLYGPVISGVPIPTIHTALNSGYCMWWGSNHRLSIRNTWETHAALPSAP